MNNKNDLTHGSVRKKLVKLTIPMLFGMLSMVMFNLVDTFFISRLGTNELAAMGFTFPVIMLIMSIALGLGIATASVISQAIGRGDRHQLKRLTTDSLIISFFVVVVFAVLGLLTMDWTFKLLGANADTLPLVKEYMKIWYLGIPFVIIPMVGNNALRACGNMLFPSLIMVTSILFNILLDPLLIFGLWGFPRLGLTGAALATVISRATALIFSFLVLHYKEDLLDFSLPPLTKFINSLKQIFYIAVPTAVSRLMVPLTMSVVMRLVAGFGTAAVAAVGIAIKIEMFVAVAIMALSTALIPFVGQNWGAKQFARVKEATNSANKFSILWGLIHLVLFLFLAIPLGHLFGKDPQVAKYIVYYLWITPVGYGLRGVTFLTTSVFNAVNKPFLAISLNVVRTFLFYIPFAFVGSLAGGIIGLFIGLTLANIISGLISLLALRKAAEI